MQPSSRRRTSLPTLLVVIEDRSGRLCVGTLGGGVVLREGGRFVVPAELRDLPGRRVLAIVEDRDGAVWLGTEAGGLWIGTSAGGLKRFANGKVEHWTTRNGLASDQVRTLLEDRRGDLWTASTARDCSQPQSCDA